MSARPLKDLLLPREHGAWGMLAEPLIVGLIAAPSLFGAALVAPAALAAFFARRPLMLGFFSRAARADGSYAAARGLAIGLSLFSLLLIAAAAPFAPNPASLLVAVAIAAALGMVQLRFDVNKQGRSLVAELSGAFALAALAPMLVLANTDAPGLALTLGLLVAAKQLAAITYIRLRLRASRGTAGGRDWILMVVGLVALSALSPQAVYAVALVVVRIVAGLSVVRRPVTPKHLGFIELAVGLTYAVLVGVVMQARL